MTEPGTLPEGIEQLIERELDALNLHDVNCDSLQEYGGGVWKPCDCQRQKVQDAREAMRRIAAEGAAQERARHEAVIAAAEQANRFLRNIEWNDTWSEDGACDVRHAIDTALDALATRTPPPPEAQE